MANIPISALPNVKPTGFTPSDLLVLVNYFDPPFTGVTKNTELSAITSYIVSSVSEFSGGTVTGETIFTGGLSATTLSATTIDLCTSNGTLYTDSISGCSPINMLSETIFSQGLSANTISGGTFFGDGSNLTNIVSGITNVGSGLTLSNIVGNEVQIKTVTGDSLNKITTIIKDDSVEFGINEQNLSLWNLVVQGNKLLDGSVAWVSGLTFEVTDLSYIINGIIYSASSTSITLQSGDTTFDRIDVIYADTGSTIGVLSGTPSNNPEKPLVDNDTQVEVTFVSIPANSTGTTISGLTIYDENLGTGGTEWNFSSFGPQASKINPNFTGVTYTGTKSIRITGYTGQNFATNGTGFNLTTGTPIEITDYGSLQFAIRNISTIYPETRLYISLLGPNGSVSSTYTQLLYKGPSNFPSGIAYNATNNTSWQIISIPLWRFYAANTQIYGVRVQLYNATAANQINIYLDKFQFIAGVTTSPPASTWFFVTGNAGSTSPSLPYSSLAIRGGSNMTSTVTPNTVTMNLNSAISLSTVSATTFSGRTLTIQSGITANTIKITSGATNGYVLTSDSSGNASWSPSTGGGSFTGGTVTGSTTFTGGLSATTLSATTIDLCASNGTLYTDSISGCSPINILSETIFNQGLSANTISANTISVSTYQNVPNIYTSDGTLNANRTVSLNSYSLNFDEDITINNIKFGRGNTNNPLNDTIAIGNSALINLNNGIADGNIAIGTSAMTDNVTGGYNTAVGHYSLKKSTNKWNTALGYESLTNLESGQNNTSIGYRSGFNMISADANTNIGAYSMFYTTVGGQNISVGYQSLQANTEGSRNTALGYNSLFNNTTGNTNTAIGHGTLTSNITGDDNTAVGYSANVSSSGLTNATAIGANTIVSASNSLVLGNNANVGVGISSPNAKLHINNTTTGNTVLFEDDTNVDSTPFVINNMGNVGIGALTSAYKLDVKGVIRAYGAGNTGVIISEDTQVGGAKIEINPQVSLGVPSIGTTGNFPLLFTTNNTEKLRITSSGNVGIGISSPTAKLHINNTTTGNTALFEDDTNPDSTPFVITNDGRVGVGILLPTEKFEVSGRTATTNLRVSNPYVPTGSTDPTGSAGDISWSGNSFYWKDSSQWYVVTGSTF